MSRMILAPLSFLLTLTLWYSFTPVTETASTINWMSWEEAIERSQEGDKKIFVDVYTDYCSWCKKMDTQTFSDPVVVSYINKNFLPVKFNAEFTETITFKEKEYKFVPNKNKSRDKGYHELVLWMTNGKIQGYPTVVFIDEKQEVIQSIPGFLPAKKFEPIMTFFGGNHYKKVPWGIYVKQYNREKTQGTPASDTPN